MPARNVIILCGPTASGKSALALKLARQADGVIINADSMQVYAGIPIVTAAPSAEDMAHAPHRLFGYMDPATPCSVAMWLEAARIAVYETWQEGKTPIIVGGTGMYIKALLNGIVAIPDISPFIRQEARALGREAAYTTLQRHDPETASRLKPGDTQRIVRAYEVWRETGKPLSYWQAQPPLLPLPDARFITCALDIPRDTLYQRCNQRLLAMLENGALEEINALLSRNLSSDLPAMRAVGVPELIRYIQGEWTIEYATEKAQQSTRNYAKRQLTWLRHQLPDAIPIPYPYDRLPAELVDLP